MWARFAEDSDRLAELVGRGLTMPEACARASISYKTARQWIDKGRGDPDGVYGAWARRVDAVAASTTRTSSEPSSARLPAGR